MTHMLKTAAATVRSHLMREREARAHGSKGRGNAHFAAVMGGAIDDALTESPACCIADVLDSDTDLQAKLQELIGADSRDERIATASNLKHALARHVQWTLGECQSTLHECLHEFKVADDSSIGDSGTSSGDSSKERHDRASGTGLHSASLSADAAAKETDASLNKLDLLIESGVSAEGSEGSLRPVSTSSRGKSSYQQRLRNS